MVQTNADGLPMHVLSSNGQHHFGIPSANRLGQLTGLILCKADR